MANLIGLQIYAYGSDLVGYPLAQTFKMDFPFANIMVRAVNQPNTTGVALGSGQVIYSAVKVLATGDIYGVIETVSAIAALS